MYYPEKLKIHSRYSWNFRDAPPFNATAVKAYSQRIDDILPLHIHDFYELNIILGGNGRHYIGDRNVPTQKGDVFVIPPSISHGYFADGTLEIFHILLSNEFLHRYSAPLMKLTGYKMLFEVEPILRQSVESYFYLSLDGKELDGLTPLFGEMLGECAKSGSDKDIRLSFTALHLLGKLCEKMSEEKLGNGEKSLGRHTVSVIKSIEYIENNFDKKLSFHEAAADCGMSYCTYLRVFKQLTGTTPIKYQRDCRIKKAENLLAFTTETVLSVALALGYYDSAHFIREFKSLKGLSPTRFRESAAKNDNAHI